MASEKEKTKIDLKTSAETASDPVEAPHPASNYVYPAQDKAPSHVGPRNYAKMVGLMLLSIFLLMEIVWSVWAPLAVFQGTFETQFPTDPVRAAFLYSQGLWLMFFKSLLEGGLLHALEKLVAVPYLLVLIVLHPVLLMALHLWRNRQSSKRRKAIWWLLWLASCALCSPIVSGLYFLLELRMWSKRTVVTAWITTICAAGWMTPAVLSMILSYLRMSQSIYLEPILTATTWIGTIAMLICFSNMAADAARQSGIPLEPIAVPSSAWRGMTQS